MEKFNSLLKYEKYFFVFVSILFLIPVIGNTYFVTVDGPAHLYNASLLKQLWFNNQTFLRSFFEINTQLNSNWINHIWDCIVGTALPSFLTEKSFLILYILFMPFAFRYLLHSIVEPSAKTKLSSYLIFPFIYSLPLRFGFFNFCFGIPILFFCLGLWLRNNKNYSLKKAIILSLLITLLYFSHLFNFILFGLIVFIYEMIEYFKNKNLSITVTRLKRVLIVSLPAIVFFVLFIISNNQYEHKPPVYSENKLLIQQLTEIGPVITMNHEDELPYSKIYFYVLCVLFILSIISFIKNRNQDQNKIAWLITAAVLSIIYFLFPDWISSGGFISIRLLLLFYLLIIVWIGIQEIELKFLIVPIAIILITSFAFLKYHYNLSKPYSDYAEEFAAAGTKIETGKTVLPLNYQQNLLFTNISNYMGCEKPIVVLDNYEPAKPHFPLLWKKGQCIYDIMLHYGNRTPQCIDIEKYETATGHKIDYISQWFYEDGIKDSCAVNTQTVLANQFNLIYESTSKRLKLFKRKND